MNENAELLSKDDSLLLVVDFQKSMLAGCVASDRVQNNASILMDVARILSIPIILTEQNPRKLGTFLPELATKVPNSAVFSKHQFGCFENETIARAIAATRRKSIILAGIEAHICIFQTGIGCYFDDEVHAMMGLGSDHYQSMYHFTVGEALEDHRLQILAPYHHLERF